LRVREGREVGVEIEGEWGRVRGFVQAVRRRDETA
jgi:hypothetical protein